MTNLLGCLNNHKETEAELSCWKLQGVDIIVCPIDYQILQQSTEFYDSGVLTTLNIQQTVCNKIVDLYEVVHCYL